MVNLRWRCDTMVRVVGPYSASSLVESVHVECASPLRFSNESTGALQPSVHSTNIVKEQRSAWNVVGRSNG